MRCWNLTTVAALLLAGAIVIASAAPSRRNPQNSWPFGMDEEVNTDTLQQSSPLLDKLLDRIYRRLQDRIGNTNNDFSNTDSRTLTDVDQLIFPGGANELDETIPARPARGKCVGRFVPYMMNC
ncbi:uncharacterized protein [Amphiura filiformis]|uniref:uncharacterized protein n=1 Tax=Amphiura filiformis TaxID=82378 RepID=UPI003B2271FC